MRPMPLLTLMPSPRGMRVDLAKRDAFARDGGGQRCVQEEWEGRGNEKLMDAAPEGVRAAERREAAFHAAPGSAKGTGAPQQSGVGGEREETTL